MKRFRARGVYRMTGNDVWVTTVWRRTREEAQEDIRCFAQDGRYKEGTVRIIVEDWVL